MNKDFRGIVGKIKELKNIEPRAEWKTQNRDLLLSKIKSEIQPAEVKLSFSEYGRFFVQIIRQRFLLEPAVMILLVLGFSVGSSLAVNAAYYSLPGEPLYRMKIALERAQIAITPDENKQVELKIEFAQNRVDEFDKIVAQTNVEPATKTERINLVMKELQKNVVAVKQHIDKPASDEKNILPADREKTLQMAFAISSSAQELAKSLDQKISDLSAVEQVDVASAVTEAVESVQQTDLSAQELIKETQEAQAAATSTPETINDVATSTINIQTTEPAETGGAPEIAAPVVEPVNNGQTNQSN